MIVRMKKVTVLSLAAHRDESLDALRGLGVLHVTPLQSVTTGDAESERRALEEARAVYAVLERLSAAGTAETSAAPASKSGPALLKGGLLLLTRQRDRFEALQRLNDSIRRLEPFGDFDPALVRELADRGVSIRLFRTDHKAELELPDGVVRLDLSRDKKFVHLALIGAGGWNVPHALELPLPERSLGDVIRERDLLKAEQTSDDKALAELAPHLPLIAAAITEIADHVHWLEARDGMSAEGPLLLLQGYMPAATLPALQEEARKQGWGWLADDPTESDPVPTLIRYSPWTRPIQSLMNMLGLVPGYWEMDVSPIFLVFFSLFFAMLVGDAVYGLLFLGLTALIRKKWKTAPASLVPLLTILSLATLAWGVLTGTYLGIEALPTPLSRLKVDLLTDANQLENLCFLIGAIQMSLAHAWCVLRNRRSLLALAHVGWIGSCWMMYSLATHLILDKPYLPGIFWIFGVSVALIFLFSVPFKKLKAEYASLMNLPFSIIGNFSDTVSYLRLYLVGSSSIVLVKAFNDILFGGDAPMTLGRGLVGAIIIFLVHVLNILLSALAVLVHGVRLNALEFSSHLGIQWLGRPFKPFRKESSPSH